MAIEWVTALLDDCGKDRHGVDLFGKDILLLGRLLTTLVSLSATSREKHLSALFMFCIDICALRR